MPSYWLVTEHDGHVGVAPLIGPAATDADRDENADMKPLVWIGRLGPAQRALLVEVIRRAPHRYLVASARWLGTFEHVLKSGNDADAVAAYAEVAMRSPAAWIPENLR